MIAYFWAEFKKRSFWQDALFGCVLCLILHFYVGSEVLYVPEYETRRYQLHEAVLSNTAPDEGWGRLGATSVNLRRLVPWMSVAIAKVTHLGILKSYQLIDLFALGGFFIVLAAYLRYWYDRRLVHVGMLYTAVVLIMTYSLHYYHPWDKPSWLLWLLMLMAVRHKDVVLLSLLLPVTMLTKFDALYFPLLWLFVHRKQGLRAWLVSGGLLGLTVGIYALLVWRYGLDLSGRETISQMVSHNLKLLAEYNLTYPPLLAFGLPLWFVLRNWRRLDTFQRACVLFGALWIAPHPITVNCIEVRAEIPFLLLLLPAAVEGYRALTETPAEPAQGEAG